MWIGRTKIRNTSQYIAHFWQYPQNRNIRNIVKVEFMAEMLYWIPVDCTDVPNQVATECNLRGSGLLSFDLIFVSILQILESKRAVMEGLVPENINGLNE